MAAPTVAEFLVDYPTFTNAPTALIQSRLDQAALRTNATVWEDKYAMGVMLRAADLLAKTPEGRRMRLVQADGKSIYWDDLQTLVRLVAVGVSRNT